MGEIDHFEDDSGTDTFFFDEEEDELQTCTSQSRNENTNVDKARNVFDLGCR